MNDANRPKEESGEGAASNRLSHNVSATLSDSKIQTAWETVKTNISRRSSLTNIFRRWSRSSTEIEAEDQSEQTQR